MCITCILPVFCEQGQLIKTWLPRPRSNDYWFAFVFCLERQAQVNRICFEACGKDILINLRSNASVCSLVSIVLPQESQRNGLRSKIRFASFFSGLKNRSLQPFGNQTVNLVYSRSFPFHSNRTKLTYQVNTFNLMTKISLIGLRF